MHDIMWEEARDADPRKVGASCVIDHLVANDILALDLFERRVNVFVILLVGVLSDTLEYDDDQARKRLAPEDGHAGVDEGEHWHCGSKGEERGRA